MNKQTLLITVAISALSLSACSNSGTTAGSYNGLNSYNSSKASNIVDKAIEKALKEAKTDQERLTILGQMYSRDPDNQAVAISYAKALRNDEQINPSKRVLEKFTTGENKTSEALTELSITNIALGDFEAAEINAIDAIELSPKNGRAYLSMGTALDAQGKHEKAEKAFRSGIKNWKGDPAPILNNLALNLASQGRLEQSLEILHKAKKISPNRMEIERNLRIISTLQETAGTPPPTPNIKPEETTETSFDTVKKIENKTEETTKTKKEEVKNEKSSVPIPARKKGSISSNNLNTKETIDETKIKETLDKETAKDINGVNKKEKAVIKYRPLND